MTLLTSKFPRLLFQFFSIFCTLLFSLSLYASGELTISHANIPTELRLPAVTKILKSSNGYLWIGTQSGLYLFRGKHLEKFSSDSTDRYWIPDSHITDIEESSDGDVFISTLGSGLFKWAHQGNKPQLIDDFSQTGQAFLTEIFSSTQGDLWLIKGDLILRYDLNTQKTSSWILGNLTGGNNDIPSSLSETDDGRLIIGHTNSYSIWERDSKSLETTLFQEPKTKESFQITALMSLSNNTVLMGTDTGSVAIVDIDTGSTIAHHQIGSEHLLITDFKVHRQGYLIGTDQGLFITKKDLSSFSEISHSGAGLTSKDIYSIHDSGDYLLIGTKSGLNLLAYSTFKLVNTTSNGVNDEVLDFAEDPIGNIWIGTYNGLFRIDKNGTVHDGVADSINYNRSSQLFDQRVTAVASNKGTIWVGFFDGGILALNSSDLSSGAQQRFLFEAGIVDILTDNEDGSAWVASFRKGLFRIHDNSVVSFQDSGQLDEDSIAFLYSLASSDILIGCFHATYIYDKANGIFKHLPFSFNGNKTQPIIYSAKELKSGDVWFGTKDNGFFVWKYSDRTTDNLTLSKVDSAEHTGKLTIYGIQQDQASDIWLSTNKGIVKLDSDGNFIRRFTMADGLQGMDFTFNSSFQSSDGRIFFGGPGGYNVFRPEEVSTQIDPPRTKLTSVRFTSDSLDNILLTGDSSTVRLTHKDKFVTFEFSIMEFVNTGDSQFRYMLENYDADWIENGHSHKATYTNLPTGEYRFRVQGMNSAGMWDPEGDAIALSVAPPPWLSGWAYAVYSMAFLLLAWAAHRVYHSYVVERRAAELAQEMFEAEEHAEDDRQEQIEYQDELIHSAYQHKLDTLNLLNTFVFEGGKSNSGSFSEPGLSGARKRIHVLTIMEDHIYYQPDGPAADLHSFVDAIIPKLLEHSPVDPDTVVTINGIPESLIPTAIASPLAIIIYELLENCIQHAFEPDSPANYIILNLEKSACKGTSLSRHTLTINDDGIGAPAGVLQMAEPGSGLYVVQTIVRELEGHIELSIEQGTKIIVSLVEPE